MTLDKAGILPLRRQIALWLKLADKRSDTVRRPLKMCTIPNLERDDRRAPFREPPSTVTMRGSDDRDRIEIREPRTRNLTFLEIISGAVTIARIGSPRAALDRCVTDLKNIGVDLSSEEIAILAKDLAWISRLGTDHNIESRTRALVNALQRTTGEPVGDSTAGA